MVSKEVCTWYETGPVIRVTATGIHLSGPLKFLAYKLFPTANFQECLVTAVNLSCSQQLYKIYLDGVRPGDYKVLVVQQARDQRYYEE